MSETPPDTGVGPDEPAATPRSARRNRRLAIVGALALVLGSGTVLLGITTSGSRSGTLATAATRVNASMSCMRSLDSNNYPNVYLDWTIPTGTARGTTFRVFVKTSTPTYADTTARASKEYTSSYPSTSMEVDYTAANTSQTYVLTWGRTSSTGTDDKYDEFLCPKSGNS